MNDFTKRVHEQVLKSITTIRESFVGSEIVFTNGSCYKFYQILRLVHPVKPYYANGHIVCELNGFFYDITGEVKGDFVLFDENFYADFEMGITYENIVNNRFNGHIDFIQCPNCDETIKIA